MAVLTSLIFIEIQWNGLLLAKADGASSYIETLTLEEVLSTFPSYLNESFNLLLDIVDLLMGKPEEANFFCTVNGL